MCVFLDFFKRFIHFLFMIIQLLLRSAPCASAWWNIQRLAELQWRHSALTFILFDAGILVSEFGRIIILGASF